MLSNNFSGTALIYSVRRAFFFLSLGDDSFTYLNFAVVGFFPPLHIFLKSFARDSLNTSILMCGFAENEEVPTENGNRL